MQNKLSDRRLLCNVYYYVLVISLDIKEHSSTDFKWYSVSYTLFKRKGNSFVSHTCFEGQKL